LIIRYLATATQQQHSNNCSVDSAEGIVVNDKMAQEMDLKRMKGI
jgi:hypothetical protein